jgi:hypothetical protein
MANLLIADNGVSSGTSGIKYAGDTSGQLALQSTTSAGTATTALTIDNNQNTTLAGYLNTPNTFGFKNRIINGAMNISQYNGTNAVTPSTTAAYVYYIDRFNFSASQASKLTFQQLSANPPIGFSNYLGVSCAATASVGSSDYFYISQAIEGFNTSDLGFGTANAKTVTLSFWAYSNLTGTFGGSLLNSANNRAYPFNYTISSANTWTSISITIAGDQSGTWVGATNGVGIRVCWGLGVGTANSGTAGAWSSGYYVTSTGATSLMGSTSNYLYITGVQLEKGTTATSFDYRDYGRELMMAWRYFRQTPLGSNTGYGEGTIYGYNLANYSCGQSYPLPVAMRTTPTVAFGGSWTHSNTTTSTPVASPNDYQSVFIYVGATATGPFNVQPYSTGYITYTAEL